METAKHRRTLNWKARIEKCFMLVQCLFRVKSVFITTTWVLGTVCRFWAAISVENCFNLLNFTSKNIQKETRRLITTTCWSLLAEDEEWRKVLIWARDLRGPSLYKFLPARFQHSVLSVYPFRGHLIGVSPYILSPKEEEDLECFYIRATTRHHFLYIMIARIQDKKIFFLGSLQFSVLRADFHRLLSSLSIAQ